MTILIIIINTFFAYYY